LFPENKRTAGDVLFLTNISLLFSAGCIVQTPDTPLLFFWIFCLYCAAQVIMKQKAIYWYLGGAALGLGLLSKYTMILILPCIFLFFLLSADDRYWLKRKEPYLAVVIAFVVFSPVLYWNWQHDWVSFLYQLGHGLKPQKTEITHIGVKVLEYFASQAAVITPLLFLAFVLYSIKGFFIAIREKNRSYLFLTLLSWPIIFFFALSSALGKVAEANWPACAYVAGAILAVHVFHKVYDKSSFHRYFIYLGVLLAFVITIVVHVHLFSPFLPVSAKTDPTSQFYGWKELGEKIKEFTEKDKTKKVAFIAGDRGTIIAQAVFYTHHRFLGIDFRQPQRYLFLKDIRWLQGKDAIIITRASDKSLDFYRAYFESCIPLAVYPLTFRGEKIKSYDLLIAWGKNFHGDWAPAP